MQLFDLDNSNSIELEEFIAVASLNDKILGKKRTADEPLQLDLGLLSQHLRQYKVIKPYREPCKMWIQLILYNYIKMEYSIGLYASWVTSGIINPVRLHDAKSVFTAKKEQIEESLLFCFLSDVLFDTCTAPSHFTHIANNTNGSFQSTAHTIQ